jgi:signal transduction histidine kinase
LEFAIRELKRVALIVRSLLDVSRQGNDYREEVNVNLVMEDSLRVLANLVKKREVEIFRDLAEEGAVITGNYSQLSQVMINLVKNALQALPEEKGRLSLLTRKENDQVIIEVADNGRGMKPEELREIFTPFYTTKPVGEGIGLGLYLASTIVDRHGGEIVVTSEPGRGSRFRVVLPIKREGP